MIDNAHDGGGEGHDRYTVSLSANQISLCEGVLALKKPTVLVMINGGAISIDGLKDSAPAIIEVQYTRDACIHPYTHAPMHSYTHAPMLHTYIYTLYTNTPMHPRHHHHSHAITITTHTPSMLLHTSPSTHYRCYY